MGSLLQHDGLGPTLLAECDRCSAQIMAFGGQSSQRPDLENRLIAEGWQLTDVSSWLCPKCGGRSPDPSCA